MGSHPFPFRTRKLSPSAPMVLGGRLPGRVGRRRISQQKAPLRRGLLPFSAREPRAQLAWSVGGDCPRLRCQSGTLRPCLPARHRQRLVAAVVQEAAVQEATPPAVAVRPGVRAHRSGKVDPRVGHDHPAGGGPRVSVVAPGTAAPAPRTASPRGPTRIPTTATRSASRKRSARRRGASWPGAARSAWRTTSAMVHPGRGAMP